MIRTFSDKRLANFWEKDKPLKLPIKAAKKIDRILTLLNEADSKGKMLETFGSPGFNLKPFKGRADCWEIRVSGNYRLLFVYKDGNVYEIEYTDAIH